MNAFYSDEFTCAAVRGLLFDAFSVSVGGVRSAETVFIDQKTLANAEDVLIAQWPVVCRIVGRKLTFRSDELCARRAGRILRLLLKMAAQLFDMPPYCIQTVRKRARLKETGKFTGTTCYLLIPQSTGI